MRRNRIEKGRRGEIKQNFRKIMKCLCSGEQLRAADEIVPSAETLESKDCTTSENSSRVGEILRKPDTGNIEEAESSLRESGCLNYEVCLFIVFEVSSSIEYSVFINSLPVFIYLSI